MFTGLIEEIGIVKNFSKLANGALLTLECDKALAGTKTGDSISIDGVCQTVISLDKNCFSVQVSEETLRVTTFSGLSNGNKVNLERAITANSRFGGHIVTGHVDGLVKTEAIIKQSEFYNIKFKVEENLRKYIVKKGSITVNGISLTIAEVFLNTFTVFVIPHTFENTNLNGLKSGDFVNIEVDILAKYVENFLSMSNNSTIDKNFLKENGFL